MRSLASWMVFLWTCVGALAAITVFACIHGPAWTAALSGVCLGFNFDRVARLQSMLKRRS